MLKQAICFLLLLSFGRQAIAAPTSQIAAQAEAMADAFTREVPLNVQDDLLGLNEEEPSSDSYDFTTQVPSNLKIVGRGLENRKTHEVIAIACVGKIADQVEPSCGRMQHILITPNQEPRFIGESFIASYQHFDGTLKEPTQAELEETVKSVNQDVKIYKKQKNYRHNAIMLFTGGMTTMGGALFMMGKLSLTMGQVGLIWGGVLVLVFGAMELGTNPYFTKSGSISSAMANKDGWSWSSRPKKVSAKSFEWIKKYLAEKK